MMFAPLWRPWRLCSCICKCQCNWTACEYVLELIQKKLQCVLHTLSLATGIFWWKSMPWEKLSNLEFCMESARCVLPWTAGFSFFTFFTFLFMTWFKTRNARDFFSTWIIKPHQSVASSPGTMYDASQRDFLFFLSICFCFLVGFSEERKSSMEKNVLFLSLCSLECINAVPATTGQHQWRSCALSQLKCFSSGFPFRIPGFSIGMVHIDWSSCVEQTISRWQVKESNHSLAILHSQSNTTTTTSFCHGWHLVELCQIAIGICEDFKFATLHKSLKFSCLLVIFHHFQRK